MSASLLLYKAIMPDGLPPYYLLFMSDTGNWIRDYFNAYYASAEARPHQSRRHPRRTKSSACGFLCRETSTSKFDEIQLEVEKLRKMLSYRTDDAEAYELRRRPASKMRRTHY